MNIESLETNNNIFNEDEMEEEEDGSAYDNFTDYINSENNNNNFDDSHKEIEQNDYQFN